jgi:hypothetical protein
MASILSANRQANAHAQSEVITLKIEHQKALDAKDIEHRSALMLLKSKHASVVAEKNAIIKRLKYALAETEGLAGDVASEYHSLKMTVAEAAKANTAKELKLTKTAASRLEKVKHSNALLQQTTHENVIELMDEVDMLKIKIESMANEIIDAYHTIEASGISI